MDRRFHVDDPRPVTDDEIIDSIRIYASRNDLPPPAPASAAVKLEEIVGYPMPPLLRRLYLEVANGGFGPDGAVVSLTDCGRWFSDEESLLSLYPAWTSKPPEWTPETWLLYDQPDHVIPLMTLGCAIWWHIDFSTAEGQMWGWDPNWRCPRHVLFPERYTLAQWLGDWLDGNRRFPEPPPVDDCQDCAP